jgi:hypothetical protein
MDNIIVMKILQAENDATDEKFYMNILLLACNSENLLVLM